jgi:hypothetical protein
MAKEEIEKKSTSGKVRIEDNIIYWDYENENFLQIDINEIVVIGEYTNSDGPYFDDWFLTFVTKDGQWQSIPRYADNIDDLTTYLSTKFHQDLHTTNLANSTEWKSSVLYPPHLKDKILFTLTPSSTYKTPKTFLDKILSSVGFGNFDTTQDIGLTEDVKNELANASR